MAKTLKQKIADSKKEAAKRKKSGSFESIDPFKAFLELVDSKKTSKILYSKEQSYPYVVIDHITIWISQQSLKGWDLNKIKKNLNILKIGYSKGDWTLFKYKDDEEGIDLSWD